MNTTTDKTATDKIYRFVITENDAPGSYRVVMHEESGRYGYALSDVRADSFGGVVPALKKAIAAFGWGVSSWATRTRDGKWTEMGAVL